MLKNLCKTTSLECKTSSFGWRESLKNVFAKASYYFSLITWTMFTARWKKLKEAALSNLIVTNVQALNIRLKKKLVLSKISPQSSRNEFSIAHMCFDRSTFPEENKGLVKGRSL